MVEVYRNRQRSTELESQLTLRWDLDLPNNLALCKDILRALELSVSKLEESNAFMRESIEITEDADLAEYIEENELVLRRKHCQIKQVKSHIDLLQSMEKS